MRLIVALIVSIAAIGGCASTSTTPAPDAQADLADPAEPRMDRLTLSDTLAQGTDVVIDNPYGNVGLRFGGYEHRIDVQAVRQQPEAAIEIALQPRVIDGRWTLAPRLPAGVLLAQGQRLDLVAFVPEGHGVTIVTESGSVDARGVRGNLDIRSTAGDIAVRGTKGAVNAQTGTGLIEVALGTAPPGSLQRLATRSGNIVVGVDDGLNASVAMATSGVFATEYSLQVEHRQGQEPNKQAIASVGTDAARVELSSARGEIRLLRRADFTPATAVGAGDKSFQGEKKMNQAQAP